MSSNLKIVIRTLICLAVFVLMTMFGFYLYGVQMPWQRTIDSDTLFVSAPEIADAIKESRLQDVTVKLPNGNKVLHTKSVVDVNVHLEYQSVRDWLLGSPIEYRVEYKWDEARLKKVLDGWKTPSKSARFGFEKYSEDLEHRTRLVILPEVTGNNYQASKLYRKIVSSVTKCKFVVNAKKLCTPPKITEETLQPWYDRVKWINDVHIKYSRGYEVKIDAEYLYNKLSPDFTFDVDSVDLSDLLEEVGKHYNTHEDSMSFTDSSGISRSVRYNTFGKFVNTVAEESALKELIESRSVDYKREPVMRGYDVFEDTYLEVSIDKQHVWHYVRGKLCCESDVVTGRKNKYDTPTGVFYVSERIPGKYLVGPGYRTWVNKWMRLNNNGIGFHDASWRGNFGKQVYTYNGSHGCINLPSSYAYKLYDEIYTGIPVVVY